MGLRTKIKNQGRRLFLAAWLLGFALTLPACQPKRDGQATHESPIVTSAPTVVEPKTGPTPI